MLANDDSLQLHHAQSVNSDISGAEKPAKSVKLPTGLSHKATALDHLALELEFVTKVKLLPRRENADDTILDRKRLYSLQSCQSLYCKRSVQDQAVLLQPCEGQLRAR